jgi:hypothetical protein
MTKLTAGPQLRLSSNDRLAVIIASLLLIAVIGHDLWQRARRAEIGADAAAADRDAPGEATLRGEIIDGPAVTGAYFREGYAWAEAHGVADQAYCSSDSRAYRDGCRAFVAGVH